MARIFERTTAALAALAVLLVAGSAFAQTKQKQDPLGKELKNYWTVDRHLPVLQDRLYQRGGRFGLGIYGGLMSSEPFYWYTPVGGRLSFFFSDYAGIEIGGQYMGSSSDTPGPLTHPTEITNFFADKLQGAFNPSTDLEDRFLWRANATLLWSPLYGKWAFLNNKLSHLDIDLALGGGAVSVLRPNYARSSASTVITPEVVFGGGIHFFISHHLTLRGDGRFYVYEGADTPSARSNYDPVDQTQVSNKSNFYKRLRVPAEFLLGLTYLF